MIDLLRKDWFVKAVLLVWLLSSVFLVFLLRIIDTITHVDLYSYGLRFDVAWADPYWNALHLIYVILAIPAVLSVVVLIAGLRKTSTGGRVVKRVINRASNTQPQTTKESSMLIRCIHCKKVFGKPETILDFSNGKPQLANVCPYCGHVLGKPDEKGISTRITSVEVEEDVEA